MEIGVEKREGGSKLSITGDMTIYCAHELKRALAESLAACDTLEVDLSGASEVDSSGLQLLILAKREALKAGKCFRVSSASHAAAEVIKLFNVEGYLEKEPG